MPELPDITVYVEALRERIVGRRISHVRLISPFLLRTAEPPIDSIVGRRVTGVSRLAKRIVIDLEGDLRLVLHLMIAGRLQWRDTPQNTHGAPAAAGGRPAAAGGRPPADVNRRGAAVSRQTAASIGFESGELLFTEAGTKKRASLYLERGDAALAGHDRGGLELDDIDLDAFKQALTRENHTLKRALTDPRILSGIGNAYSDEILHRARLSPVKLTSRLADDEIEQLFAAARETLAEWTDRLRREYAGRFPTKVTAFRPEMNVHGRYREPCRVCGTPVQRIRYATNETNYCPRCQTDGKLLADRALSRLLKQDWPRSIDELDDMLPTARKTGAESAESSDRKSTPPDRGSTRSRKLRSP